MLNVIPTFPWNLDWSWGLEIRTLLAKVSYQSCFCKPDKGPKHRLSSSWRQTIVYRDIINKLLNTVLVVWNQYTQVEATGMVPVLSKLTWHESNFGHCLMTRGLGFAEHGLLFFWAHHDAVWFKNSSSLTFLLASVHCLFPRITELCSPTCQLLPTSTNHIVLLGLC